MDIKKIAETLDNAARNAKPVPQLNLGDAFTIKDAYRVQKASISRRYERGEKFVGLKLGFTSKAKMEQMGVHDMIWGRLTDAMLIKREGKLPLDKFIHPRAEPELCFLVKKTIDKELTLEEAKDYIVGVAAAIEVIDSRFENFKFSLEDVIADNCSSSAFIIGPWNSLDKPIEKLKMDLIIDGDVVQTGSSEAILGNPWESVVAIARLAKEIGNNIPKGTYILAGAATPAVYLKSGNTVKVVVEELGEVSFSVA